MGEETDTAASVAPVAPAAKGRGRPKKADKPAEKVDLKTENESGAGDARPTRGGRGSPRKAAEAATNAMKDQAAGTKREADGDDAAPKAKRGRGRPKGTAGKKKAKTAPKKGGRAKAGRKAKAATSESEGAAGDTGGESGGD